ncbi:MAG: DEAD/DEAH box helicase family protein [Symploca sp. SIO2G7]|nr:DEAD/DEAH box helicase family protein [Symploca sp. SIO2G7]
MSLLLPDRSWRISYSSNENNPIADFYIPALECAVQYDRKSGFFNSAILSKVARGLGAMLHNEGKMRLIMGCQFNPQDLQAIQQGYELREALLTRLDAELQPPENFAQLKHFEILSWLIANGYLDIKIAVPLKSNGIPEASHTQLDPYHIFHEKVGIFTDTQGNQLAFNGSNNESLSGWESNVESFHVYCSWEGDRDLERVNEELFRFEQIWNNLAPNVRIFEVPEAVRQKLLRYTPATKPTWNQQAEFDTRLLSQEKGGNGEMGKWGEAFDSVTKSNKETVVRSLDLINDGLLNSSDRSQDNDSVQNSDRKQDHNLNQDSDRSQDARTTDLPGISETQWEQEHQGFTQLVNLYQHPGCLDFCLKSIPIIPWPHQIKILRRVAQQFPRSFLIADEVGLGKTIETGLILRYLLVSKKVKRVLILAPASVQPQWQEELREKFNLHFWSYAQGELTDPYGNTVSTVTNPWNTKDLILASSHLVRRTERMQELLEADSWDLVVLDEAHHARRKSPQARKDTFNRLLELMQQLKEKTRALVLLSATPMQIDPIEVFDLLSLLGLQGHWSYADNFCNYFATLPQPPDRFILEFWQQMSVDYFQCGGKSCSRLQQYLEQRDRFLAYKLQNIWQGGQKIVNHKQYLTDKPFITTSRQYLTVNTPLKDLMFRHTRDTLRQYYRLGLLNRDIPQRDVRDNAITLELNREVPLYRAVSEYVRNFYRLAQKQERKALGFLMTLYRKRLTSSFYAIRESLQRRLDSLLKGTGSSITNDDLSDIDEADDTVIAGLESFLEPVDPREITYLEDLLRQFENTGEDSKLSHLIVTLRQELIERESAIIFTQYTDTMDYLRESLRQLYGNQVACYSGRGGELYRGSEWCILPKELIKRQFREEQIKILLCTESASEGLNLQTCGVLINYDLPWNPMRVEQRIGRLDRIGQIYPTVKIHNFYYDGTVEAKVYRKLRDRINAFATVVGNLQPILAQVPTFIEQAAISADPQEEDVLMSEFEEVLNTPPLRPALEEMVAMDVEADLEDIRKPISGAPITPETIEQLFVTSALLKSCGTVFESRDGRIWRLSYKEQSYQITFYPEVFDEMPSLRLMSFGEPLFEEMINGLKKLRR